MSEPLRFERTDLGNAEAFAAQHVEALRYVKDRKRWLVWHKGRWRLDESGAADRAAKETVRGLLKEALELHEEQRKAALVHAVRSQAEPRIRALLTLASTERVIVLTANQLDHDPFLLSCANGTIDLRTGELRPHDPGDLISLGTEIAYDPEARCPRWLQFLAEVFDSDAELVAFVWRAFGYSLTGDTREHVLFVPHGSGCNGKSTLLEIGRELLGGLAATAGSDSFMRSRNDRGVPNDIARLNRARLVIASESGEGRRLDEAVVKMLTGGDTVTARFLYGEFFEFTPHFKLWFATNSLPRVDGADDAIWRRVLPVPFEVSFEGREDRELIGALEAELPGILAWAVRGCLAWQRDGLQPPAAVQQAKSAYRQGEDILGSFLSERCALELGGYVTVADFRESYESYCKEIGERAPSGVALGKQMSKRGHPSSKIAERRVYEGLKLA